MPKYPYQQVADALRDKIRDGTYPPEARLPSRRELCAQFGVSDIVIGKAMMILRQEGLVQSLPGVGVFVAGVPQ